MKIFTYICRCFAPSIFAILCIWGQTTAQTTLIDPAGAGGFELGSTFAANGWTVVNGTGVTNQWFTGTVPSLFTTRSAYISDNALGTTHNFSTGAGSTVHFYRDVTLPAGQTSLAYSYQWYAQGESTFDFVQISVGPTSITPTAAAGTAGSLALTSPIIAGTTVIGGHNLQGTLQTVNGNLSSASFGNCNAPTTIRVFISWRNDGSGGTQPPAAIDNISLISSVPSGAPLAGTVTVGPTGTFPTLTAAANAVNSNGVSAPLIIELQAAYTGTGETFPITLAGQASCNPPTAVNTVTIRPEASALSLSISGSNATTLLDLNNGQWWRIDGRPGGLGTNKFITISNTNTSGSAVRYINESSNNIIRYSTLQGVATSTTSGVVFFSTTGGLNGNDNNLIDNCDIRDGATTPTNGVFSSGTTTTTATHNSGNIVSNCNVINTFAAASTSFGINVSTGSTDWDILNNSIFQTASRASSTIWGGIQVSNVSTGNNFRVAGNFIGGTAPLCGSGPLTFTGTTLNFRAINLSLAGAVVSLISNNTIQNLNLTTTGTSGFNGGILSANGLVDITNNTIGSAVTTSDITISASGSAFSFNGIIAGGVTPANLMNITGNRVFGIAMTVTGAPLTVPTFRAISVQGTALGNGYNVSNNIIGSASVPNSISLNGNSTLLGIISFSNALNQTINNNTISNLANPNTGASASVVGLQAQGSGTSPALLGTFTVTGNTIRDLSTSSASTAISALGMAVLGTGQTTGSNLVSQNTIHSISNNNPTVATGAFGAFFNLPAAIPSVVSRNLIHSMNLSTTAAGTITGIQINSGNATYQNNMVRVGINAAGGDITGPYAVNGITDAAGANNLYHNSVYVGGSGVASGTSNSFALNSTVTVNTRNYVNNIFVNARSNGAATGKHYAIRVGGTTVNPAGLTTNFNDLRATGTGSFIGLFNAIDQTTLADWRTATGQDGNSINADPMFIAPTGTANTVDLHIAAAIPTAIESAGLNVASVTDDFDGQTRSGLTPTDMGADAGNFLLLDIQPPTILFTPLTSLCTAPGANIPLNGVTITDATGIPVAGALIPRIYYRKNAGAWFSQAGTLVSGIATNSTWDFNIVVSDMGGLSPLDVVSYYVIAQDIVAPTPNIGSNAPGVVAVNVNTVTTHPAIPNTVLLVGSLAGTYAVGPTGIYPSITAAVGAVIANGVTAPVVFELQAAYVSTVETFPITLGTTSVCGNGLSSTNTVTFRPAAGTTGLSINGTNAGPTININGGNWWRIDGRPGGVGTAKELSITNNNVAGQAIQFINEGSNNIVRFCKTQGVNTSVTSGVIVFGTTIGANGNDNNVIDNCDVFDGATTPTNGIHALGTTTTVATHNDNNSITNCNVFNYFSATLNSTGIKTDVGNSAWTISNNSLYQTVTPRTMTAAVTHRGLWITPNTGNLTPQASGFIITGNFIGGLTPNAGGAPYNITSAVAALFFAMDLSVGNGVATSVQGNTIQNINFTTTSTATPNFAAISAVNGNLNVGTVTGNTIGAATGTGSITVNNAAAGIVWGIRLNGGTNTIMDCRNNTIGSISVVGSATAQGGFIGIGCSGGVTTNVSIINNTIGSTTTANSINLATAGTGTGSVTGIAVTSGPSVINVNGNTIANLNNSSTATVTAQTRGIVVSTGLATITGNTIRNLSNSSSNTSGAPSNAVIGLVMNSTIAGAIVSGNTIHSLILNTTAVTGSVQAVGFFFSGSTTLASTVARNLIHSFDVAAVNPAVIITGIDVAAGTGTFVNNMIRLGIRTDGTDLTTPLTVRGMSVNAGEQIGFYFNSIYIGGTGVGSTATTTFAFNRSTTAGAHDVRNNIFVNNRSNATTGGLHYAIRLAASTTVFPTFNYNNYQYTGTGGTFAFNGTADVPAYVAGWVAGDVNSIVGNPQFIAPTGTAATVDLHISPTNPTVIESAGASIASVTDDFDSQVRASFSPTDIGADAGNFVANDISAPVIVYTPIAVGCGTGNIDLNNVSIVDATGVPTAGAFVPRVYYRKGMGAFFSQPGTLASGTGTNGTWNFTIVAADMGGLAVSDIVQYYVIAQDLSVTPLIGSNPSGAVATNVNSVTTPPAILNSITVLNTLTGTFTVGASGTYTTLTAAVAAYNTSCIVGPVVYNLIDPTYSTSETFPITINAVSGASATNTLTIKATLPGTTISGSSASGLIRLNGADFVTINGSIGNTVNSFCPTPVIASRDLTISNVNTGTSSAVIWISSASATNGANNNTIRNCNVVGNSFTTTLAAIMTSGTVMGGVAETANSNNTFENNACNTAQSGIVLVGPTGNELNNVVIGNIVGSSIVANKLGLNGIALIQQQNIDCSFNRVLGVVTSTTSTTSGISVSGTFSGGSISRNVISDVKNTNATGFGSNGIQLNGSTTVPASNLTISNNFISDIASDGFNGVGIGDNGYGIILATGGGYNIYYNTVNLNTNQFDIGAAGNPAAINITSGITTAGSVNLVNNILVNNQTQTVGERFSIIVASANTVFGAINNNDYFTLGTNLGRFGGTPILMPTLASIQTNVGGNLNSLVVNPVFTSATDLHLVGSNTANAALFCAGTPIASVTTDIDCAARGLTTSTIGADEVTPSVTLSTVETSGTTPNDAVICAGATVTINSTLTNGSATPTYLWSTTATTANLTGLTPAATTTYSVTVTSAGCQATASQTVTVNPLPTPVIAVAETSGTTNNDGILCTGASATLTASGGTSYLWSTTATTAAISVTTAGTYTVVVSNANGCSASATRTITENPLPTPAIAVVETSGTANNDGIICSGASVSLTASGGTSYLWSTTATTATISVTTAGTFTVVVTNANGCSASTSTTVVVNQSPTPVITGVSSVCVGNPVNLTVNGGTTYLWGTNATTQSITLTMPGAPSVIGVTVTDGNNCTGSTSQGLTPLLLPTISGTLTEPTTCVTADGGINISVFGTVSGYAWTTSGTGSIPAGQAANEDLTGLTAGSYTVLVTGTNGCTSSASYTLGIPGGCTICPTIGAVTVSTPTCSNTTSTLTATGLTSMGNTFGISFVRFAAATATPYTGGTVLATVSNGALSGGGTTATATATLAAGAYVIYAILTPLPADAGCRPSASASGTVGAPPTAAIAVSETSGTTPNDGILCAGASANLTASGGATYLWSTTATTESISVTTAGTYTVIVTSAAGCNSIATRTITVNPLPTPAIAVVEASGVTPNDGVICQGASATLTASGGTSYAWSTNATTASISVTTAGTYTVVVTNANGCSSSTSVVITVNPLPTPAIAIAETSGTASNDGTICAGSSATLNASGGTSYVWSTTATTASISVTTAGTYTVVVTNANGCSASTSVVITVNPLPTPAIAVAETSGIANNDGAICSGASATLTASGGTSYLWSTTATTAAITVNPGATTTYTVIVTNANGCSATATRTITVNPLPTSFTITGGGARCTTDSGAPVGLSGSESGVSYQLQLNGNNVGTPVAGTGAAINFPLQGATGAYTVVATNTGTGCSAAFAGSVTITTVTCAPVISDPCVCLNNATTLTNGQFGEVITVNAPAGQTWVVSAVTGLFSNLSLAPPSAPTPITVGTVLVASGTTYTLNGRHIDELGYTLSVTNNRGTTLTIGNACQYPNPSITTDLTVPFCLYSDPINLVGNPGDANIVSQGFTVNGVAATQFNPGAGLGAYVIVYTVNGGVPKAFGANDPGCIQTVSRIVQVVPTSGNISCNNFVQVSLDDDCSVEITPDMVLEGNAACYDDYEVKITGQTGVPNYGNILTGANIGQTLKVTVKHLVSGNTCWGNIKVEDKLVPTIVCTNFNISCAETNVTPSYLSGTLGIAAANPVATDNCSSVTKTYTDVWTDLDCPASPTAGNITGRIVRTWVATDASGNSVTCTQTINIIGARIFDVNFPVDAILNCSANVNTSPAATGTPFITFNYPSGPRNYSIWPGSNYCELQTAFVDQEIPVCDGTYKILRTWTAYDWCTPTSPFPPTTNPAYYVQLVKVVDETGPAFACPDALTVSTNTNNCCSVVDLPNVVITDNCSRINSITAQITGIDPYNGSVIGTFEVGGVLQNFPGNNLWTSDTLGNWGFTPCLPIGTHIVRYTAKDDCGNESSCTFNLTVADQNPPTVVSEEFTQVSLGIDGFVFVNASSFDNGSFDNCGPVYFKARRMDANPIQTNTLFHDQVKFGCSDIGDTITVVFRVYDVDPGAGSKELDFLEGDYNDVMVQVFVEDKIKPTCLAPANVSVSCEAFDPSLWAYGQPQTSDNCSNPTVTGTLVLTQFDSLCNKGTITRRWTVVDAAGNSVLCSQRIVITYNQNYWVKFPADRIVTVCDGTSIFGAPEFYGEDCELMATSYVDEFFTVIPDACYKIERTWTVINWCKYDPNLPANNDLNVYVPNPNPNATTNHPTNLPGVTVSAPGTTVVGWVPTSVKINPTDPLATNYSTFWRKEANSYTYKQIVKVLDGQDPVVACPTSPTDYCDYSVNDAQFYNAMQYWDPLVGSHDLCEGDANIEITATDGCSGAAISFRYLLFLDMDANGTMETVINSVNPPGFNNINYNNVNNANYAGGTPWQFDFRPVAGDRKWGWGMQQDAPSGNNRTARVRWFNQANNPAAGAVPQLPYGTHKIKWFIEDGCGNETVCENTIVVKDCKKPTVVCINGLSVNLMNISGGMVQLWASDFLQYAEDNCTPAPQIKIAIRRKGVADGQGSVTGFPRNADGSPQTGVQFTCADLGTQLVELWGLDLANNADYCETYVLIQDNAFVCNPIDATIAGALKTEEVEGVEDANVELVGTSNGVPVFNEVFTQQTGDYLFSNALPYASNATVTPTLELDPLNGVNTWDLILISRHILGLEPLNTPYKLIAADANKSGTVTTFDIVELRKLILGTYPKLPSNSSWRFVDKAQVFTNPANPFADVIRENKQIANIQQSIMDGDFVGAKIGDVDNTATPNNLVASDDRTAGTLLFDVEERSVKAGEEFTVNFKAAEQVAGYQFTLNLSGLEVVNLVPGAKMSDENFAVFTSTTLGGQNAITTSADDVKGEFAVTFRATKGGKLSQMLSVSSRITRAVAFTGTEKMGVGLRFNNGGSTVITGQAFEVYQNTPNPWVSKTQIGFYLPSATAAKLTVYDATGRTVYTANGDFGKGYNAFTIDRKVITTVGSLYYKVETTTDSGVKQMIQMK